MTFRRAQQLGHWRHAGHWIPPAGRRGETCRKIPSQISPQYSISVTWILTYILAIYGILNGARRSLDIKTIDWQRPLHVDLKLCFVCDQLTTTISFPYDQARCKTTDYTLTLFSYPILPTYLPLNRIRTIQLNEDMVERMNVWPRVKVRLIGNLHIKLIFADRRTVRVQVFRRFFGKDRMNHF